MGAPSMQQMPDVDGRPAWAFPSLDQQATADPSWAATLDTLRPPRKLDQQVPEWRKESKVRPVVFADAGVLTEDTVHLHLEQRVVQRLLARFRSQGFVHHDLSRACLAQAQDSIPRVILLARLSLYGIGAERLHEQLVPITARWIEPDKRNGPLRPYASDTEVSTLDLLEKTLQRPHAPSVDNAVGDRLIDSAQLDIEQLLPYVTERAEQAAEAAATKLAERGEREANDLYETLDAQRARVTARLKVFDTGQGVLDLKFENNAELRQLEADIRSWRVRLDQFAKDLDTEPQRIRDFYQIAARRIEPVGLVYLWPESN
jgi:hypothetical protein